MNTIQEPTTLLPNDLDASAQNTFADETPVPVLEQAPDELRVFVGQLATLFGADQMVQIEWPTPECIQLSRFALESGAAEVQEYHSGNRGLRLPLTDGTATAIFSLGSLVGFDDATVARWIAELSRVSAGSLWLTLAAAPGRNRAWWENRFFAAGFRKHPRLMEVLPYETLENDGDTIILILHKISAPALARYPLAALKAERDLHMDMTRETGRRSDAHVARYIMARRYLPEAGLVLDAACGLGYGSAVLACTHPDVQIVGLDNSDYAVAYAQACYQPTYANLGFRVGDACDLSQFSSDSVDLVVSFETVEHLREPERFLGEVRRVLKSGGRFVCSVPNMWVDEHGKDPNPWHFHVFDFAKLSALCGQFFQVEHAYLQTAGGGMKLTRATRQLCQVPLPATGLQDKAEWWLVAAVKA